MIIDKMILQFALCIRFKMQVFLTSPKKHKTYTSKIYILPSKNDNYDIFIYLSYFVCLKPHEFLKGMEKKVTDLTMLKLSYFKNIKTFKKIQNKKKLCWEKKKPKQPQHVQIDK